MMPVRTWTSSCVCMCTFWCSGMRATKCHTHRHTDTNPTKTDTDTQTWTHSSHKPVYASREGREGEVTTASTRKRTQPMEEANRVSSRNRIQWPMGRGSNCWCGIRNQRVASLTTRSRDHAADRTRGTSKAAVSAALRVSTWKKRAKRASSSSPICEPVSVSLSVCPQRLFFLLFLWCPLRSLFLFLFGELQSSVTCTKSSLLCV